VAPVVARRGDPSLAGAKPAGTRGRGGFSPGLLSTPSSGVSSTATYMPGDSTPSRASRLICSSGSPPGRPRWTSACEMPCALASSDLSTRWSSDERSAV
jgi:hypothetical protein